jgi:long-chain fatty acid transport protein
MLMNSILKVTAKTGFVVNLLLHSGLVQASGYAIIEQSVKSLGNAFAGSAAVADDASTIFFNPAGLTRLAGQQLLVGANLIVPVAEFHNQDSTNAIGGRPIGRSESDAGQTKIVPNLYYAVKLSDQFNLGLAISAPFALATKYDRDWIGRYNAVESEITTININPALAYKVNEQLSVGAGISAEYIDVTLSQAIDFGTLAFLGGVPGALPSRPALDGFSEVKGDDWGYGFNLGLLYEIDAATRLGLAYRSKISHTLEGDNRLTVPAVLTRVFGPSRTLGASADATLPETAALSGYHRLNASWAILADVTWTRWSRFDELRIKFEDGSESVQPEDWRNSWRYSLGVDYYHSPKWTFRAGIAYDETPVPSPERRTPRIPDNSRSWIALGASYQFSPRLSFDFGYAHLFFNDPRINDTELTTGSLAGLPIGSTLRGKYHDQVDIVSAQLQWDF